MQNKTDRQKGLLERNQQREARQKQAEAAINEGLQREAARHEAVVKNMHRLRALRLERDQKRER
jgi:hypothetical protein